jgi:hypothetical protein
MAFLKRTKNWSGVFLKLKVVIAFLKYAEIEVASIQLTLFTRNATWCYCLPEDKLLSPPAPDEEEVRLGQRFMPSVVQA